MVVLCLVIVAIAAVFFVLRAIQKDVGSEKLVRGIEMVILCGIPAVPALWRSGNKLAAVGVFVTIVVVLLMIIGVLGSNGVFD